MSARRGAARRAPAKPTKPTKKTKTRAKTKARIKQLAPEVPKPTFGEKIGAKLSDLGDRLLEQAEQDPDKLISNAASLLNSTEKLVEAVKKDPEGAKRALRSGVMSLAASFMRSARERARSA